MLLLDVSKCHEKLLRCQYWWIYLMSFWWCPKRKKKKKSQGLIKEIHQWQWPDDCTETHFLYIIGDGINFKSTHEFSYCTAAHLSLSWRKFFFKFAFILKIKWLCLLSCCEWLESADWSSVCKKTWHAVRSQQSTAVVGCRAHVTTTINKRTNVKCRFQPTDSIFSSLVKQRFKHTFIHQSIPFSRKPSFRL